MQFALRPFQDNDAAQCCDIIKRCIPLMDGLNDAARTYLAAKNTPSRLTEDLQATPALVCFMDQTVLGLGAL